MKSILLFFLCLISVQLFSQSDQGKIIFNETIQLEIDVPEEHREQLKALLPKEREAKKVLLFNASESIYKDYEEAEDDVIEAGSEESGMHMKMIIERPDNELYKNISDNQMIEKQEFFGKNFLITSEVGPFEWKLAQEQKEILGFVCQKATTEYEDQKVEVWFSPQLPIPNGPMQYGQLPGMILELVVNDGDTHVIASEIMLQDLEEEINAPSKGKKVTREEYHDIVYKKTQEMEEEFGSGKGRMIIKTHKN